MRNINGETLEIKKSNDKVKIEMSIYGDNGIEGGFILLSIKEAKDFAFQILKETRK